MADEDSNLNNEFENFKSQLNTLMKSLDELEGQNLQRACNLLECTVRFHIKKRGIEYSGPKSMNGFSCQSEKLQLTSTEHDNSFDNQLSLTEKFFSNIAEEPYINDTLLNASSISEESSRSIYQSKECFCNSEILTSCPIHFKVSQSIQLNSESIQNSYQNSIEFKDEYADTYLDLSQKAGSPFSFVKPDDHNQSNGRGEEHDSAVILNLCSKSKSSDWKDHNKGFPSESSLNEELESLSYINAPSLLVDDKEHENISSNCIVNPHSMNIHALSSTKVKVTQSSCEFNANHVNNVKEFSKVSLLTNFNSNVSVIHSTNDLKSNLSSELLLKTESEKNCHRYFMESSEIKSTREEEHMITNTPEEENMMTNISDCTKSNLSGNVSFSEYSILHLKENYKILPSDSFENTNDAQSKCHTILNLKKTTANLEKDDTVQNNLLANSSNFIEEYSNFSSQNDFENNLVKNFVHQTDDCATALNLVNKKLKKAPDSPIESYGNDALSVIEKGESLKSYQVDNRLVFSPSNELILSNETPVTFEGSEENHSDNKKCNLLNELHPLCCRKCRTEIADISLWLDHQKKCLSNLFCHHCDIKFTTKVTYVKHIASHKRNTCTLCTSTFSRYKFLQAHMKKAHNTSLSYKTFSCQHCDRVFLKRSSLFHHLQLHALPKQKVCQECGKVLECESSFRDHMEEHVRTAPQQCHLCKAIFRRYQQYSIHMEGHKNNVCEYCATSCSSKKSLFNHYKADHPDLPQKVILNKKYKCDLCPKIFIRPSLLRDHRMSHTDKNPLECHSCNLKFTQKSSHIKHLKTILHQHTTVAANVPNSQEIKNGHICEHCRIVFPSLQLLSKHSLYVHNTGLNHNCSLCEYKTKRKTLLKRHVDMHLEKKKFMCELCGSSFHSMTSLKDHFTFLHSDERSFKCTECDKSFKNKSCLSRHKRTHSNERPYKCECGSCYKQLSHLTRHLSSVHRKKLKTRRLKKYSSIKEEQDVGKQKAEIKHTSLNNFCYSEDFTTDEPGAFIPSAQELSVKRESNDILLASGNAVLMTEDVTPGPTPLFTVLDSQLIHLIPSTLQIHEEGIHTVSLVSGELHTLSIAPTQYQISPNLPSTDGPFGNPETNETLMINASQSPTGSSITLEQINSAASSNLSLTEAKMEINHLRNSNQKGDDHLNLDDDETDLQFTTNSLQEHHYESNEGETENISSLSSSHYLNSQESSLNQEIVHNISIF